ncbi:MAG: crotonase/enoyl-CoA hydratase family protein [Methylocystis sp.]
MNIRAAVAPRAPETFPIGDFKFLEVVYDSEVQAVWMNYKASAPHHFPLEMFDEIVKVRESLRGLWKSADGDHWPIRYFAIGSKRPDVFSLGGDLAAFAEAVRNGEHEMLRAHANICVDIMHSLDAGFDLPIVTLSAVNGLCLGGGFEGALVTDFLIVERDAKLGLPEIGFNTFPGMGAVSLLTRRAEPALAERIISSGAIYSGQEMFDLGIVDILSPEGQARETATAWMREGGENRWRKRRALAEARRRCFGMPREELRYIVDLWVDCVKALGERDLRHMDRLVAAQKRLSRTRQHPRPDPEVERASKGAIEIAND